MRKEQLEYARQQEAQERSSEPQQQAQPPRTEPQPERRREKQPQTPALFGFVGKKAG